MTEARRKRGRERVYDVQRTREAILSAAETLFAERGFDGTSVDAIASRAGYNKSLLSASRALPSCLWSLPSAMDQPSTCSPSDCCCWRLAASWWPLRSGDREPSPAGAFCSSRSVLLSTFRSSSALP